MRRVESTAKRASSDDGGGPLREGLQGCFAARSAYVEPKEQDLSHSLLHLTF